MTAGDAARPLAGAGPPTATRYALQHGAVRPRRATTTCCCSSTRTCTRSACGPTRPTCWSTRPPSGPSWCAADRGGDVTYHGPGQLVGYPILTVPGTRGGGMADTVAYVHSVEQLLIDALADARPARRRPPPPATRACGSAPTATDPARSRRSACGSAGAGRCTASPSTSTPTWPCSATSCPAASPTRRSPRWRPRASTSPMRRGGRRRGRAGPPSAGARAGCERQDVVWRHRPEDLAPFSRGDRAPAMPARSRDAAAHVPVRIDTAPCGAPGSTRPASAQGLAIGEPQAGVAAGAGPHGPDVPAAQAHAARPRPGHGVRGGRLPQPLRVLGRRHRHLHAQRRALHPGLRVLPGRHPPARSRSTPTSPSGWPRPSSALGLAFAVLTDGGPRRPGRRRGRRTSPTTVAAIRRRCPGTCGRGADPRLQGRPRRARRDLRRPSRRAQPQRRDGGPAAAGGAARRPCYARSLAVLARAKAAGLTTKSGLIVGPGRDRRRGASAPSPTWPRSASTSSPSASTCGPPRTTCRWPAGGRPTSSRRWPGSGEALGIGHVEAAPAHPLAATTPSRRPARCAPPTWSAERRRRRRRTPSSARAGGRPEPASPRPPAVAHSADGTHPRPPRRRPGRVDRSTARVLRGQRPLGARRPRQRLAQGLRHVPGPRRAPRSATSTSPAAGWRPSPTCATTVASP